MRNHLSKLVYIISALTLVYSLGYDLTQTSTCGSFNGTVCQSWNIETVLTYQTPSCFPAHAKVITPHGPKKLEDLQVGQMILAYDSENRENTFTRVKAWLHRDVMRKFQYSVLKDQERRTRLIASDFHNIAVIDQYAAIHYEYAHESSGKNLVTSRFTNRRIWEEEHQVFKGLYAPYTQLSNFYILDESGEGEEYLVHSFASIRDPESYEGIFGFFMEMSEYLGLNNQPATSQYQHPVGEVLQYLFPSLVENGETEQEKYWSKRVLYSGGSYAVSANNQRKNNLRKLVAVCSILQLGIVVLFQ